MPTASLNPTTDDFAALLEESFSGSAMIEGRVVPATVTDVTFDFVTVDVGLKTEGRIPAREFATDDKQPMVGEIVEIYLERIENALGDAVLSRDKARREEAWTRLERLHEKKEIVKGAIVGRIKGGFSVDLGGVNAFLPGSQVDVRPIRDIGPLMGQAQPFAILKIDRPRGNVVVSRRAVLEEARAEQRAEIVGLMSEGDRRIGVVKNITDYGAFVDLGGIDGLLHVTDMSWKRVSHPSQVVEVGQEVEVQIIKINPETQRISLGMKQLMADPWDGVAAKYPAGAKLTGRVTNITDYGAFVELEDGVEGLIHVSEMSWTKKNVHPGKIISSSEEVDVMVLEVDAEKRRISLGLKQVMNNPWEAFMAHHPIGTNVEGDVRGITEFGMFIGLGPDLDGMVHINDLDWNVAGEEAIKRYAKGDTVQARVLDIDIEKERISLGIKQLSLDPADAVDLRKNSVVTGKVIAVTTGGIEVAIADGAMTAFIRKADLSRDRSEQRPERFDVGDMVDALVIAFDKAARKVSLSIKAMEIKDEQEAIEQYGSADAGASLGDILGAAIGAQAEPSGAMHFRSVFQSRPAPVERRTGPFGATTPVRPRAPVDAAEQAFKNQLESHANRLRDTLKDWTKKKGKADLSAWTAFVAQYANSSVRADQRRYAMILLAKCEMESKAGMHLVAQLDALEAVAKAQQFPELQKEAMRVIEAVSG